MVSKLGNHVKSIIYLSGPISLDGRAIPEQINEFIGVFSRHAANLRKQGFTVIDPCDLDKQDSWESYMRLNIPDVCRCHLVLTLPRWQESRGSRLEVFIARELATPVMDIGAFYDEEALVSNDLSP